MYEILRHFRAEVHNHVEKKQHSSILWKKDKCTKFKLCYKLGDCGSSKPYLSVCMTSFYNIMTYLITMPGSDLD